MNKLRLLDNDQEVVAQRRVNLAASEKVIREFLDKHEIRRDMDVEELDMSGKELVDVARLERFRNLCRLWAHANRIRRLNFVHNLACLRELYLQHNMIQSVRHCLRAQTNLVVLFLQGNQISGLRETARELTFLKNLTNLNLFDNPIALESEYRPLLVFKCASLELLDRNVVGANEKIRSTQTYEPRRQQISNKRAFLRSFDLERHLTIANKQRLAPRRRRSLSIPTEGGQEKRWLPPLHDPSATTLNRSIKEFSYFDWSKVKLHQKSHFDDDDNSLHQLPTVTPTVTTVEQQPASSFRKQPVSLRELPQVITIRFA